MFDLSWTELLVIAAVAIIVVGPKDLPRALRALGRWAAKAKGMARDFQNQFNEALREAELDTIKKEVESVGKIDPLANMRKEVRDIEAGLKTGVDQKPPSRSGKTPEKGQGETAVTTAAETPPQPTETAPSDAGAGAKS